MQFPLFIGLQRSRRLDVLLSVFHLLAAFSACFALWPRAGWPYRLACLAILCLIALSAWRSIRHRREPERLQLAADGVLSLHFSDADGDVQQARILPGSLASPHLVVLRLRIESETGETHGAHAYALTLLPDQMPAEQFRRLLICLRWLLKTDAAARD